MMLKNITGVSGETGFLDSESDPLKIPLPLREGLGEG
jgi:hypothetical protein